MRLESTVLEMESGKWSQKLHYVVSIPVKKETVIDCKVAFVNYIQLFKIMLNTVFIV